jgi:translation initiation factor IF-3
MLKVNSVGLFYIASMCAKELAKHAQTLANEQLLPIIEIKSKSGDPVCFVLDVYKHFDRIESNEAEV